LTSASYLRHTLEELTCIKSKPNRKGGSAGDGAGHPLLHPTEDTARSGLGEAARLREGSAGAAHGWAAIRFPWPRMVFGMRIALPSTGELPPARRPGGSPSPLY